MDRKYENHTEESTSKMLEEIRYWIENKLYLVVEILVIAAIIAFVIVLFIALFISLAGFVKMFLGI